MTDDEAYALFRVSDLLEAPRRQAEASVERVEVTAEMVEDRPNRYRPGPLMRLWLGHRLATTDAWGEFMEQREAIMRARGRVLVHGLGLGAVIRPMLAVGAERIDVVELSLGVCKLVAPGFVDDPRVHVWLGDAFDRNAVGGTFDLVYSDVWTDDEDHSAEHERLRALFEGRCDEHLFWRPDVRYA